MNFSLPRYLSPETILNGGGPAADVWSYGIILLEMCIGKLWSNLKPGPILRRILTLVHANNPAERIAREHDCFEQYKVGNFSFYTLELLYYGDVIIIKLCRLIFVMYVTTK